MTKHNDGGVPVQVGPRGSSVGMCCFAITISLLLLSGWLTDIRRVDLALLLVVQVSLAMTGFVQGWYSGARPVQIVTFGFVFAYLGVAPIYQLARVRASWNDSAVLYDDPDRTLIAIILTVLATGVLLVGFALAATRIDERSRPPSRPVATRGGVAWVLLFAAAALTPTAVAAAGGLGGLFSTRVDREATLARQGVDLASSGGFALGLVSILPGALALAATVVFLVRIRPVVRARGLGKVPLGDFLGFVASAGLLALHVNPFTSSRFLLIMALGGIAMLFVAPRTRRAGGWLGAIVLVGTLLVYPLLNFFRYGKSEVVTSGWDALSSPDFDGFQQIINAVGYVEHHGHSYGGFTFSGLLFFVPRSIWTGKSEPASVLVAEDRGYAFTNLSMPVHAELFLDFGIVGMCLIILLLGVLLGRLDSFWLHRPDSRAATMTPVVALVMLGVVRGPIGAAAPIYLSVILFVYLGLRPTPSIGRTRRRASLRLPTRVRGSDPPPSAAASGARRETGAAARSVRPTTGD